MEQLAEQSVIAAMVSRAVMDATHPPVRKLTNEAGKVTMHYVYKRDRIEKERKDALEWINASENALMSFEWCCDVLDIHPDAIRHTVAHRPRETYNAMQRQHQIIQRGPQVTADEG